jgi:putative glutathione S-transferase
MLVDGAWTQEDRRTDATDGSFQRPESAFRDRVTADGASGFAAEPGRYHLYVNLGCPWAYRTAVFRRLKGLEDVVSMSLLRPDAGPEGWCFSDDEDCGPDPLYGASQLHEIYSRADPRATTRVTVPVLWDRKRETLVNNESAEIIRMLNSEFDAFTDVDTDYYPETLRAEIDAINAVVYARVNNGVYRCGFAATQEAYAQAYTELFATLDRLESTLDQQRYLVGGRLTEADWRLFATLVRFDVAYYSRFNCNKRRLVDYPNLWSYARELYAVEGVAEITSFDHIKRIYFKSRQPLRVLPLGPELDWHAPHDRGRFGT